MNASGDTESSAPLMIFAGNANRKLANDIARELGVPMGKAVVDRFSDGEVAVEIMENIRGQDIYLIQPTCAPTADNFVELLVMVDALKRALHRVSLRLSPILDIPGRIVGQGLQGYRLQQRLLPR